MLMSAVNGYSKGKDSQIAELSRSPLFALHLMGSETHQNALVEENAQLKAELEELRKKNKKQTDQVSSSVMRTLVSRAMSFPSTCFACMYFVAWVWSHIRLSQNLPMCTAGKGVSEGERFAQDPGAYLEGPHSSAGGRSRGAQSDICRFCIVSATGHTYGRLACIISLWPSCPTAFSSRYFCTTIRYFATPTPRHVPPCRWCEHRNALYNRNTRVS